MGLGFRFFFGLGFGCLRLMVSGFRLWGLGFGFGLLSLLML